MKKITNTTAEFRSRSLVLDALTPMVELAEARGQHEFVNADVLPTDGLDGRDRPLWTAMGIAIGDPVAGDKMFTRVVLPSGWSKLATDHALWSHLVDNKGRVRGRIFYKAAFYDRSAKISVVRRFYIERDFDRPDYRTVVCLRVLDCGQVVFSSTAVQVDAKDWEASDRACAAGTAECQAWLTEHGYPDHDNDAAYWDVP